MATIFTNSVGKKLIINKQIDYFTVKMTKYRAIIFDLGNVVFRCSFNETLNYWANISNKDSDYFHKILDLDTDYTHSLFEKASITPSQFRDYISQKIDYPLSIQEFDKGWNAIY